MTGWAALFPQPVWQAYLPMVFGTPSDSDRTSPCAERSFQNHISWGVYEGVEGCLNIFLQFIDKVDINELAPFTVFLGQGKMPMMMFGLSGAASPFTVLLRKKRRER